MAIKAMVRLQKTKNCIILIATIACTSIIKKSQHDRRGEEECSDFYSYHNEASATDPLLAKGTTTVAPPLRGPLQRLSCRKWLPASRLAVVIPEEKAENVSSFLRLGYKSSPESRLKVAQLPANAALLANADDDFLCAWLWRRDPRASWARPWTSLGPLGLASSCCAVASELQAPENPRYKSGGNGSLPNSPEILPADT